MSGNSDKEKVKGNSSGKEEGQHITCTDDLNNLHITCTEEIDTQQWEIVSLSGLWSKPRQFTRVGIDKMSWVLYRGFGKPTISSRWGRGYKATTNRRMCHNRGQYPRFRATRATQNPRSANWLNGSARGFGKPTISYCTNSIHTHRRCFILYTKLHWIIHTQPPPLICNIIHRSIPNIPA